MTIKMILNMSSAVSGPLQVSDQFLWFMRSELCLLAQTVTASQTLFTPGFNMRVGHVRFTSGQR